MSVYGNFNYSIYFMGGNHVMQWRKFPENKPAEDQEVLTVSESTFSGRVFSVCTFSHGNFWGQFCCETGIFDVTHWCEIVPPEDE